MQQGVSADRAPQIEASSCAATKLNPSFAPAFDRLAVFYGTQNRNLDEAHMLSIIAVQLDPGNVGFRLNATNPLMQKGRTQDAIAVLQHALNLATAPGQHAMVQSELESLERYQAERTRQEQEDGEAGRARQSADQPSADGNPVLTRHRTPEQSGEQSPDLPPDQSLERSRKDEPHGPRRTVKGILRNVHCFSPATMKLKVEGGAKPVDLRTANYYKVRYSALNFTPSGDLKPCKDLEGMKANVDYFEALNSSAEGQIVSIELTK
jgi:hypothetical protein